MAEQQNFKGLLVFGAITGVAPLVVAALNYTQYPILSVAAAVLGVWCLRYNVAMYANYRRNTGGDG